MESFKKKADAADVKIVFVYTREPHANQRFMGFDFSKESQTRSMKERLNNARRCHEKSIP